MKAIASTPESIDTPEIDTSRFSIHFHFSPHETEKDVFQMSRLSHDGWYDIYVPELGGVTERDKNTYLKLASGDSDSYRAIKELVRRGRLNQPLGFYRAIYGCNKMLLFADLSADEANQYGRNEAIEAEMAYPPGWESALRYYEERLQMVAKYFNARDIKVASTLPSLLGEVAQTPGFARKYLIRVLVTVGWWHTQQAELLRQRGFNITESWNNTPIVFSYHAEVIRSMMFSKQAPLLLLAKGLLSEFLYRTFTASDTTHKDAVSRLLVDAADPQVARKIVWSLSKQDYPMYVGLVARLFERTGLARDPYIDIDPTIKTMLGEG